VLFIDARHIYRQIDRAHPRMDVSAQIGPSSPTSSASIGARNSTSLSGGDEARTKLLEIFGKKPKFADVPVSAKPRRSSKSKRKAGPLSGSLCGRRAGERMSANEDFKEQLETLNEELETLNVKSHELEQNIARNVADLLDL